MSTLNKVITELRSQGDAKAVEGMARYGINTEKAFGVSLPFMRNYARQFKNDHNLALQLWDSGYHEARILAGIIDDKTKVTEEQMDKWVSEFDSWDICDQCCSNLFALTPFAYDKALQWALKEDEFVRRAGFVMMACIAVKRKELDDDTFNAFFKLIERQSGDERNMVKKAVNWALRQIGKRNAVLNEKAVFISERMLTSESKAALWIARDAYRELTSNNVKKRLKIIK